MRVCVPQSLCAGLTFDGRHYAARNGVMDLPDDLARRAIKNAEAFPASRPPRGVEGFICRSCGFHALIRTCGRCGGDCVRPGDLNAAEEEDRHHAAAGS